MKIVFTSLFLLFTTYQINIYSQEYVTYDNSETLDSIRFSKRSHYDSESQDFILKQFSKTSKYSTSNFDKSDNYIKIPAGREEISGKYH